MSFLQFILSSSLLIGMVMLVRVVFRKKISPKFLYALWLIPLVRLLIPFGMWELPVFGAAAEVLNAPYAYVSELLNGEADLQNVPIEISHKEEKIQLKQPETEAGTKIYDTVETPVQSVNNELETKAADIEAIKIPVMSDMQLLLCTVWILGSIIVGGYTVYQNRNFRRSIKILKTASVTDGVEVCVCENIVSPCLSGFAQPKILISEEVFQNPVLYDYAVQHEMAHFHQRDHFWTAVKILVCIVYWWNPLVWLAAFLAEEDGELACDARVLKGKSTEERKTYGYVLLQLLENAQKSTYPLYTATSFAGGKKSMKRRILDISSTSGTKKYVFLPVTLLMIVIFVLGCAVPSSKSWIKTEEWETGETEDAVTFESEYSYALQEEIKSLMIYNEIYVFGELKERNVMVYGNITERSETIRLRRETPKYEENSNKLILEYDGIGTEMLNPANDYKKGGYGWTGSALQSDDKIEINAGDDLILMGDYWNAEESVPAFDCYAMSSYSEEELKETIKDMDVVSFVRITVSNLPEEELRREFEEKSVSADENNGQMESKILNINDVLYYGTDETGPMGDSGCVAGYIQSSVEKNESPSNHEESNFGCVGNPYTYDSGDGSIMVFMEDEEYHFFYNKEAGEENQFVNEWAQAFTDKDVDAIAEMAADTAFEQMVELGLIGVEEDYRYMGWSSPWPVISTAKPFRVLYYDNLSAEILYYAWDSEPHLQVWKEFLEFEETDGKLQVVSEELQYYGEIFSAEGYYEAYPNKEISGTPMDYYLNGLGATLNKNAMLSSSGTYADLFSPDTAARKLLNLSLDEEKVKITSLEDESGEATVQIQFIRDGGVADTVEVTMWQPYGKDGIWVPK